MLELVWTGPEIFSNGIGDADKPLFQRIANNNLAAVDPTFPVVVPMQDPFFSIPPLYVPSCVKNFM